MKTQKILPILLLAGAISFSAFSQRRGIDHYFVDMPFMLLPTLESDYRVELLENYLKTTPEENNQVALKDSLQNRFGSTVRLLLLDSVNHHIRVQTSPNSRFEMKLFPQKGDTLIGVINTVCAPICSSYIRFYDTKWQEAKVDIPKLDINHWLKKGNSSEDNSLIKSIINVNFVEMIFSEQEEIVYLKNNSLEFIDRESRKKIENRIENNYISVKLFDSY